VFLLQALGCCEPYPPPTPHAAHRCSADCPWLGWAAARTASTRINIPPKVAIVEGRWAKAAEGDRRALCKGALYLGKKGTECQCQVEIRSTLKTDRAEDTLRQSKYGKISQGTRDAEPSGAHSAREKRGEDERRAGGKARRRLSRGSGGGFSKVDIGALINLPHSLCLRSLAIPFGHLRDLIAFAGSHCLPVGYFILWDFGSVLWDACGLLELVSWVRSTCWTADQNAHRCKLLSHSRPALLTPSVPVAPMGADTSRLSRALRSRQTW
jgi:hypothetical protein